MVCILLVIATDAQGQSTACLAAVAQEIQPGGACVSYVIDQTVYGGSDVDGNGTLDYRKGEYAPPINGGCATITFYPRAFLTEVKLGDKWPNADAALLEAGLATCSPYAKGYLFLILGHELLHGACGAHSSADPDCAGVSIGMGTSMAACAEATAAQECLDSPGCEPNSIDPSFMTPQDLEDYIDGLCDSYKDSQNRWNNGQFQTDAVTCACSGYIPPTGCPSIPPLPAGFDCDSEPPQSPGNNWPLADCGPCSPP